MVRWLWSSGANGWWSGLARGILVGGQRLVCGGAIGLRGLVDGGGLILCMHDSDFERDAVIFVIGEKKSKRAANCRT